ncbi:hypothetical protein CGZ80_15470 [Rhodopirellula sp. MGV]|nr:hypothetical protein CGZ80_15470 [Rhodopirellula sp. MGV]PNY37380.1 hypothetical protein C2E31_07555 [Rhodopirellula baltica]
MSARVGHGEAFDRVWQLIDADGQLSRSAINTNLSLSRTEPSVRASKVCHGRGANAVGGN